MSVQHVDANEQMGYIVCLLGISVNFCVCICQYVFVGVKMQHITGSINLDMTKLQELLIYYGLKVEFESSFLTLETDDRTSFRCERLIASVTNMQRNR